MYKKSLAPIIVIAQIPIAFYLINQIEHPYAQNGLGFLFFLLLNLIVFIFGAFIPKVFIFNYVLKKQEFIIKLTSSALISFILIFIASVNQLGFSNSVLISFVHVFVLLAMSVLEQRWFKK